MVAVLNDEQSQVLVEPAESRVLLPGVGWDTYERLLADLADCSGPRLTYDRGELEIMSPNAKHEAINEAVKVMISVLCEEWKLDVHALGSTTYKRKTFKRGFEPDSCFYFKKAALVRAKDHLDLEVDPAPELVVEIEISRSAIKKFPLFAKLGVGEVWRYDGQRVTIYVRKGETYLHQVSSRLLPGLTGATITRFLDESRSAARPMWLRQLRKWARTAKKTQ
jgi:Uma2 family endonuclease